MIAQELHPRIIENKDWATLVFLFALAFIVIAKGAFESRFNDFIRLIVSDKYIKIYRESSHLMSGFNVLLVSVNLIFSKFLIEKIIATIFGIEEVIEQFSLQKVTFRTYMGLLLLPVTFMLFYSDYITNFIIYSIIIILLTINLLAYFISLKIYQNFIFSKFFYFILYLCALEIAPYYFIYYLITKN